MKTIKNYKEFNESKFDIRANLKPKSNEELEKAMDKMNPDELLKQALEDGDLKYVQLALERGADPSIDDNYMIQFASANGHKKIVELLLKDQRVDPSADNNMAIRLTSNYGHKEVVELLLKDPRVDPTTYKNEAIQRASKKGHTEIIKILLKDPRVLSTLTPEQIEKYQKKI